MDFWGRHRFEEGECEVMVICVCTGIDTNTGIGEEQSCAWGGGPNIAIPG